MVDGRVRDRRILVKSMERCLGLVKGYWLRVRSTLEFWSLRTRMLFSATSNDTFVVTSATMAAFERLDRGNEWLKNIPLFLSPLPSWLLLRLSRSIAVFLNNPVRNVR